jgi:hypothetical protein
MIAACACIIAINIYEKEKEDKLNSEFFKY